MKKNSGKKFWRKHNDEDLKTAITILRNRGAIDETLKVAQECAEKAKLALSILEESELKTCLINIADMVVARAN